MANYHQSDRTLSIATPLGRDALLLTGFRGREAISELFRFELDVIAENGTRVPFDALLGQFIGFRMELGGGRARFFYGICSRVAQGHQDDVFTSYRLEVVPTLWFLTRISRSRIFQHVSVPEILRLVFEGLDVEYHLTGTYHPRDYCVQYDETDFAFASRLMEEEGIYYFFQHDEGRHVLVVSDTSESHPALPGAPGLIFEELLGGFRAEARVARWEKVQELRSGKVTLWDHCFELPHKHLEVEQYLQESAAVGSVPHKLKIGTNGKLEVFRYPGGYAQRFDGIDKLGGERPKDVQRIFADNERTATLRIQEEAARCVTIHGESNCGQLVAGHRFALERHFDADGDYVLTSVTHEARLEGDYRSGGDLELKYANEFTCIPVTVPYRPERRTPRPHVRGTQTAVVVGPPGEEIFTDKYSRVKVQFHWDRQHDHDVESSCWVRVATPWAGKRWGMIHIPRVGQEVVVSFEHGDPDRPLIVGSVYNADMMPPFDLPGSKSISGIRSNTHQGAGNNEISFDDTAGVERMFVNAQHNQDSVVGNDRTASVGNDSTDQVAVDSTQIVGNNLTIQVGNDQAVQVGNNLNIQVANTMTEEVGVASVEQVGVAKKILAGQNVVIGAGTSITLKCGASLIHMNQAGVIMIQGTMVNIVGAINTNVTAPLTTVSGAAVFTGGLLNVSAGGLNKVMGGTTTVDGGPVKINCG